MIKWILQKIVGTKNQRELRRIRPTVERVKEIEEALQREPEELLRSKTAAWKEHLARYLPLEAPAKPALERMDEPQLAEVAAAVEAASPCSATSSPNCPAAARPTADSIEEAKPPSTRSRSSSTETRPLPRLDPRRGLRRGQERRPPHARPDHHRLRHRHRMGHGPLRRPARRRPSPSTAA
jgi:preprotein translocase subunit SecA